MSNQQNIGNIVASGPRQTIGISTAGSPGISTAGSPGISTASSPGISTAFSSGISTAGSPGISTAGSLGISTAGSPGISTASSSGISSEPSLTILQPTGSISVSLDSNGNMTKFTPLNITNVPANILTTYSEYLTKYGLIDVELDELTFITYINKYAALLGYDTFYIQTNAKSGIPTFNLQLLNMINMMSTMGLILNNSTNNTNNNKLSIVIPKVYLSNDANIFINMLNSSFMRGQFQPNIITLIVAALNGINKGSNPQIKLANMIGLIIRVTIIILFYIQISTNSLPNINNYKPTQEAMTNAFAQLITDTFTDFPSDSCIFYNDSLNFIKFTPNICMKPPITQAPCPTFPAIPTCPPIPPFPTCPAIPKIPTFPSIPPCPPIPTQPPTLISSNTREIIVISLLTLSIFLIIFLRK